MVTKRINVLSLLVLVIAFLCVTFSNLRYGGSDPRASLLVTESIIDHKTIKLDHYDAQVRNGYGVAIHEKNGHFYYYFPIGTSIASIPFVAVAKGWGFQIVQSEYQIQMMIASITAVATLALMIMLARRFLGPWNALFVSSAFWFGTSLASTSGTALWSHNFAVVFSFLAIYFAVKSAQDNSPGVWPGIALFLFFAYLCRPTLALLSPCVLLFLFTHHRKSAVKCALLLAVLIGCFIGFSLHEFGQILPDYYLPKRLAGGYFAQALYGNLLSPARGLLIYSPFILIAWLCYRSGEKSWSIKKSWLLVGLAWPVIHLLFISRFPHWWAGYSFGARLMTDVLPGLFLLTLFTWPVSIYGLRAKVGIGLLALSILFSIAVNTYSGLFNQWTAAWNSEPSIDQYPEYLFDWSYPQFLGSKKRHEKRLREHTERLLSRNGS
ncbi:glycosyltransferase family 39 protein [Noviherbaspirillum sp. Root189]|uniref:glycosyltransferase family 39 protein n=1 Tax=Noviherbaspirillum sp. Root189 TaxID=1736487 RepID=UPI000710EF5C|nr:glycosyltransferase family 39 protein [Noviherbaspirillum sp. Root189]KRB88953.1 hypothetical protein ASE07_02100 [Noviherbaspirillum sp. Root189]